MSDIHSELASFGPEITDYLDAMGFWDIEGKYNPVDVLTSAPASAKREYLAESKKKNSRVWDLVKALIVPAAIGVGIATIRRDYKPQIARQVAKDELKAVKPSRPTAQDYQNQYIRERGGEFITKMTKTDQQKIVAFLWSNRNEHERPLAKTISQQPNLQYILDRGNHRTETIARTEKARATRYGAMHFAKDNGAKTKTWRTAGDRRVRPSHQSLSGSEIPIGEEFPHEGMFPGEQSINCRCFLTYGF